MGDTDGERSSEEATSVGAITVQNLTLWNTSSSYRWGSIAL